jgi:hypothetical protein
MDCPILGGRAGRGGIGANSEPPQGGFEDGGAGPFAAGSVLDHVARAPLGWVFAFTHGDHG